jgi:hypothetical protein
MASISVKRATVGVKAESSPYTFNAPVNTDSFPAFDIAISWNGPNYERMETREHYGKYDSIPAGAVSCDIGFKFLLVGSGTIDVAPHWNKALMAAGFRESIVAATSVTYEPWSVFDANLTGTVQRPYQAYSVAVIFRDVNNAGGTPAVRYALSGGMATMCKFTCKYGEPVICEVKYKGAYVATADVAEITPSGVSTQVPPRFLGANFVTQMSSYNAEFAQLEYDMGIESADIVDANFSATNSFKGSTIVGRRPKGKIDPAMVRVAVNDFLGIWRTGTAGAIGQTSVIGSSSGNRIKLNAQRCIYTQPSLADRNGFQTLDMPFDMTVASGGSDGADFTLTLT